jgi:hypothetical protein
LLKFFLDLYVCTFFIQTSVLVYDYVEILFPLIGFPLRKLRVAELHINCAPFVECADPSLFSKGPNTWFILMQINPALDSVIKIHFNIILTLKPRPSCIELPPSFNDTRTTHQPNQPMTPTKQTQAISFLKLSGEVLV